MKKLVPIFIYVLALLVSPSLLAQEPDHRISPVPKKLPAYLSAEEKAVTKIYKEVITSVVTILTNTERPMDSNKRMGQGLGSGVLISNDCHILTAAHVVNGSENIKVKTWDGKVRDAKILFSEKSADIALLQLMEVDNNLQHATLGDSDQLGVGQKVFAIGSPYGLENSFSSGIISAFRGFDRLYDGAINLEFIQTDAAINSGNSGGPLFNSAGEVIGIASSILTVSGGFQGIGMAVSSNTAKGLLAFEDRPWIGVEAIFMRKEDLARLFNLQLEGGLLVQDVAKGSPADKAGIKGGELPAVIGGNEVLLGGDLILGIDEFIACHVGCIQHATEELTGKKQIAIKYLRDGKEHIANLDVSEVRRNFIE